LRPTRLPLLTVIAALTLAAPASAAPRGEAKKLLAPQVAVTRAVKVHRDEITERARAFEERVDACMKDAEEIDSANDPEAMAAALAILVVLVVDLQQEMLAPVSADIRAAADRWRTMKLSDPVLRAGARAQARQLDAVMAVPPVDFCQVYDDWAAGGHQESALPAWLVDSPSTQRNHDDTAIAKAAKRLRKLGTGAKQAGAFSSLLTDLDFKRGR
jgi:hypothetical protein